MCAAQINTIVHVHVVTRHGYVIRVVIHVNHEVIGACILCYHDL